MVLGFVHDHILVQKDELFYSAGGLPNTIWPRYLSEFDSIIAMTRRKYYNSGTNISKLTLSNRENVVFCPSVYYLKMQDILLHKNKIDKEIVSFLKKCDVVILRIPSVLAFRTFKLAKKMKKTIGIEVVSSTFDVYWNYGFKGKIIAPVMEAIAKKIIKRADAVAFITDNYLQKRYPTLCKTFNNVANVSLSKDYFNSSKKDIISKTIIVGLLAPYQTKYKGQKMAIKAISYLNRTSDFSYILELVGSGNPSHLRKIAKSLHVEDKIVFKGNVNHSEIGMWFEHIDIYIQPSKAEGHGRAVIEAMGKSCPVVSTDVGGLKESVQGNLRVRYSDYVGLAEKIKLLSTDSLLRKKTCLENFNHSMLFLDSEIEKRRTKFLQYLKGINRNYEV